MRRGKYNAKKTVLDGITFDSAGEAKRYAELKLMERAGEITELVLQPSFELQPAFTDHCGRKHRAITYTADFEYHEDGQIIVEDFKGHKTEVFKLKWKVLNYIYSDGPYTFRLTS